MLQHVHTARECGAVFASFKAFESPLRHEMAVGSCHFGTHRIWWQVEARQDTRPSRSCLDTSPSARPRSVLATSRHPDAPYPRVAVQGFHPMS